MTEGAVPRTEREVPSDELFPGPNAVFRGPNAPFRDSNANFPATDANFVATGATPGQLKTLATALPLAVAQAGGGVPLRYTNDLQPFRRRARSD
jgi:hypothetical protein